MLFMNLWLALEEPSHLLIGDIVTKWLSLFSTILFLGGCHILSYGYRWPAGILIQRLTINYWHLLDTVTQDLVVRYHK